MKTQTMAPAEREALAKKVAAAFEKLASHRKDVERLWMEFGKLIPGETIMGCKNKTEFAEKILRRSLRAIEYMLDGGNHNRGHETVSRPAAALPHTVSLQPSKHNLKVMLLCLLDEIVNKYARNVPLPLLEECHMLRKHLGIAPPVRSNLLHWPEKDDESA